MAEIEAELRQQLTAAVETATHPQAVPVNVYAADEGVVVVAALPGVMGDDVRVVIDPDGSEVGSGGAARLTIDAEMRTAAPKNYLVHEWHYGPYRRELDIPDGYGATAWASFGNGQLALHLGPGEVTERFTVRPGHHEETSR
jgi:HSP20 family molecular chaperone IbpA